METKLVGPGSRLFKLSPGPFLEVQPGVLPIDLSGLPASVVEEYSTPDFEYDRGLWARLLHAGVEKVRWTHGPLHHILGDFWVSEEAFETLCSLADNVYSIMSLVFDDGKTQKRYYWRDTRSWPASRLTYSENGVLLFPFVVHDQCDPPATTPEGVLALLKAKEEFTVALPSLFDRHDRIMKLGRYAVTESFVDRWRESAVGREIAERAEPDLEFEDWQFRKADYYRWVDVDDPPEFEMSPGFWFPPGALMPERRQPL